MNAVNDKVLVRVNLDQKDYMKIGDVVVKTAHNYSSNYKERSPVIGQFSETNKYFNESQVAIFHHNHFYPPSPYFLQDNIYSVPLNKTIFGTLDSFGCMRPVFGNMICKTIPIPTPLPIPTDQQKTYINRYEIVDPGWTIHKKGDIVFTRPHSGYEIIYTWDGEERRIIKVDSDMICGILR